MKTLNTTTRRFFTALAVGLALTLTACGSGSSDSAGLSAGVVGTPGDGANQGEFDAIQKGMSREQVVSIMADAPTFQSATHVEWKKGTVTAVVAFNGSNEVNEKAVIVDGKVTNQVKY